MTIFSTPLYPQQNGLVENCMKLVNKAMAAASSTGANFREELQSAVRAHNASTHSVTKIPPEEIMLGRKIKRRLPLLNHQKVKHDDELLDKRDREAKLLVKKREDYRRKARLCRIKPGDSVIVERTIRSKGDSRFDPKRYTVLEERNGSLLLVDDAGHALKRHVSQTKQVFRWREQNQQSSVTGDRENIVEDEVIDQNKASHTKRPVRDRNQPKYLDGYVRALHTECP